MVSRRHTIRIHLNTESSLAPFVGRARELKILLRSLPQEPHAGGRIVVLAGEAGMGKSRLLHEFLASPAVDAWTLRVAAASPHGQRTPYLPLRQLVRAVIGARPDDAPPVVAARLTAGRPRDPGRFSLAAPLVP